MKKENKTLASKAEEYLQLAMNYFDQSNYDEAVIWYLKAAEQGHVEAQFKLGECYAYGFGVLEDSVEAVKWFRKAAEQGHAEAQYMLGWGYENGEGVAQDTDEAIKWYRMAAEQGHELAKLSFQELENKQKSL